MKKIRGDKPMEVIIHIYLEISQGNSLCSYLYLKQAKMPWFSFYLFFFSFYKIEQKNRVSPVLRESLALVGRCWGKEVGG
jgi:hypothetical protein